VLALEPSASTPLDTVERALELVRAVDSPHLRLIFDPANLMTVGNLDRQQEFYASVLDALAPFVVLAHAKDFTHSGDNYQTPAAGTGLLDWTGIFREMLRVGFAAPVILEHLTAEQVPAARDYLWQCFDRALTIG
jgi:sugar phosphate isomerase/epimerase